MVRFLNKFGGEMWVAEERVEEYKAAGYKLAASSDAKPTDTPARKEATKKATVKIAAKETTKKAVKE